MKYLGEIMKLNKKSMFRLEHGEETNILQLAFLVKNNEGLILIKKLFYEEQSVYYYCWD